MDNLSIGNYFLIFVIGYVIGGPIAILLIERGRKMSNFKYWLWHQLKECMGMLSPARMATPGYRERIKRKSSIFNLIVTVIFILIVFVSGMYVGSYHSGKHLADVSNENKRLTKKINELDEQQVKQTQKLAELEGIGG